MLKAACACRMMDLAMTVDLEIRKDAGIVRMNRPEVRNALSGQMIADLLDRLHAAEEDSRIKAVILTGAGRAFCAGADFNELDPTRARTIEQVRSESGRLLELFARLYAFPKPTIAAVNGPAAGGGCGLVGACDLAVGAASATFSYPETSIGFVPALVSVFLVSELGQKRARELLLAGRRLSARDAEAWGLLNEVVENGSLMDRSLELASRLASRSSSSLQLTKAFLSDLPGLSVQQGLRKALELNVLARLSPDFRESLIAILERTKRTNRGGEG